MLKEGQKPEQRNSEENIQLRKSIIVGFLREQLGKPYQYGIDSDKAGYEAFDCSSLVQSAYNSIGLRLPRTSISQATLFGRVIEEQEEYEVGDLIFFIDDATRRNQLYEKGIGHVAIYIGDGKIIHAINGAQYSGVIEETLEDFTNRRVAADGNGETDIVVSKRLFEGDFYYFRGFVKPWGSPVEYSFTERVAQMLGRVE